MPLLKGQRVQTNLGPGTILGFEAFKVNGWPDLLQDIDPENGYRVCIQLDDPTVWMPTSRSPHPYIFRSQLSTLKE